MQGTQGAPRPNTQEAGTTCQLAPHWAPKVPKVLSLLRAWEPHPHYCSPIQPGAYSRALALTAPYLQTLLLPPRLPLPSVQTLEFPVPHTPHPRACFFCQRQMTSRLHGI